LSQFQKFDSNGNFLTKWGSEGSEDGQFTKPEYIAVDSKTGNVHIAGTGNSRIEVFGIANHYKLVS
jgi:tripartite motif-containing protein 71